MSAIRVEDIQITIEEYLEGELHSDIRHEFVDGRVYAMAGASATHNIVTLNFASELRTHLRGKPCRAFMADMKVRYPDISDSFYYPDVMVNCDPAGLKKYFCNTPALIVEVLSPETMGYDLREKTIAYRNIPSLHTYIIASQEKREVIVYRRTATGWERNTLTGSDTLAVPELEFSVSLDAIYADTGL